jgi:spermidine/putrescine ABC transporter ATP-binding subunit
VAGLRLEHVSKCFGAAAAVDDVSLALETGEFLAVLGPSGCGKTTLLRLIAGFERPDAGRIALDGAALVEPPERRNIGIVFQSYALWPHMSVARNVGYPLEVRGQPREERARKVEAALATVGLAGFGERRPASLSGGQRQRVALARCLVMAPRLVLLDEPLANLDVPLRASLQDEFAAFHERTGAAMLYVTHDQEEAMALADRIAVMDRGRLAQVGAPSEVYQRPNSRWVAGFVGDVNLIEAEVTATYPSFVALARAGLKLRITPSVPVAPGTKVAVALRPEKVVIAQAQPANDAENGAGGVVADIGYLGALSLFKVQLDAGLTLKAAVMNSAATRAIHLNDRVWVSWADDAGVLLTE